MVNLLLNQVDVVFVIIIHFNSESCLRLFLYFLEELSSNKIFSTDRIENIARRMISVFEMSIKI